METAGKNSKCRERGFCLKAPVSPCVCTLRNKSRTLLLYSKLTPLSPLSMSQVLFLLHELHPNQESERVACVRRKLRGPTLAPQAKALQLIYPCDTAKNDTSSKHLLTFLRRLLCPLCHRLFGMCAVKVKGFVDVAVGELKVNPVPCDMERDTKRL